MNNPSHQIPKLLLPLVGFLAFSFHGLNAEEVILKQALPFQMISGGKVIGSAEVPVGTTVQIVARQGRHVILEYGSMRASVPQAQLGLVAEATQSAPPAVSAAPTARESRPPEAPAPAKPSDAPAGASRMAGDLGFAERIQPILEQHCVQCHNAEKKKGDVNLDGFTDALSIMERRDVWLRAFDAVDFEDMPPEPDETGFTGEHAEILTSWIEEKVKPIDEGNPVFQDPGPSLIRPLTPLEYERTIADLFGIDFDVQQAVGLESEHVEYTFTNNAAARDFDPTTLEKFFESADQVLMQLFGDTTGSWYGSRPNQQGENDRKLKQAEEARAELFAAAPDAGAILTDLASRAYRRPVSPEEVAPLVQLFEQASAGGKEFESAMRIAMKPILTSPKFLFRLEEKAVPEAQDGFAPLDDYELATRLSYFLWATMPDQPLLDAAAAGQLSNPDVLREQVRRMLADERAETLATVFAREWTQLHHLDQALPSSRNYPLFTEQAMNAMRDELIAFFNHVREADRPVTDFIDSDYTFVNADLAKIYKMQGVKGKEMTRVELAPDDHRGGLLGMGAILAMTSHTDRTKPTARGKWILDVLYGTPPPPPPANVESIDEQEKKKKGALTFREKLEMHAADPACKSCHDKIDPLGFALENYNAIGQWRDKEEGQPVDAFGKLPSGQEITGVRELKEVILQNKEKFASNITRQLLEYALGRDPVFTDELSVKQIVAEMERNDYRFSTMIEGIVTSRPFLYKRTVPNSPPMAQNQTPLAKPSNLH